MKNQPSAAHRFDITIRETVSQYLCDFVSSSPHLYQSIPHRYRLWRYDLWGLLRSRGIHTLWASMIATQRAPTSNRHCLRSSIFWSGLAVYLGTDQSWKWIPVLGLMPNSCLTVEWPSVKNLVIDDSTVRLHLNQAAFRLAPAADSSESRAPVSYFSHHNDFHHLITFLIYRRGYIFESCTSQHHIRHS